MAIKKRCVKLGNTILGEGMPKICIPVMGTSVEAIREAAARAKAAQADLIELRIDSLSCKPTVEEAAAACRAVREAAPGTALLFTHRTERDGGPGCADTAAYEALLEGICTARAADAIDCELSAGEDVFSRIVCKAHETGTAVVGSSHEFGYIGDMERAAGWLMAQERLGADICKAAVMTHSGTEALEAAYVMAKTGERLHVPIIAIAMGPMGLMTRVGAQCLGSCLTFGTAGAASAPGQIDAGELRRMLEIMYKASN